MHGVDRLNNQLPYLGPDGSLANCASCCERCNHIKMEWDLLSTRAHLEKVLTRMKTPAFCAQYNLPAA